MRKLSKSLSELEQDVMEVLWSEGPSTSEKVRTVLARKRPLKDSTVRTVLRRLEAKGAVRHTVEGRTYVYEHLLPPRQAKARALRQVIDRFCHGSVEALLFGIVDERMITSEELAEIAAKVARAERERER